MLLAVYKELEEGNLFLIQNAQEGEEGLEDARQEMAAVRGRMDLEAADLGNQHAWLHHSVAAARARCELLRVWPIAFYCHAFSLLCRLSILNGMLDCS